MIKQQTRSAAPVPLVRAEDAPIEIDLDNFFQVAADILDQSRPPMPNAKNTSIPDRNRKDLPLAE